MSLAFFSLFFFLQLSRHPHGGEKDVPEVNGLESGAVRDGEYSGFWHSVVWRSVRVPVGRVCTRVRARTRSFCAKQGYGIQPRPAKGKRVVLFRLCTVQLSWTAASRCVRACVCLFVCSWGRHWGLCLDRVDVYQSSPSVPKAVLGKYVGRRNGTAPFTFLSRWRKPLWHRAISLSLSPRLAGVLRYDFVLQYVVFHSCTKSCCVTSICVAGEYPLRTENPCSAS